MITFTICLLALVISYFTYGRFMEHIFAPDDRPTPALTKADGVDYIPLPKWKIFMIQFLNIAGLGPIFLVRSRKLYVVTLIPALFMTAVCSTYICIAPEGLGLTVMPSYIIGGVCTLLSIVWFVLWKRRYTLIQSKE